MKTNFRKIIQRLFLTSWQAHPTATLHWVCKNNDEGFWELRQKDTILLTKIPDWVGDWVWREQELAQDIYPDPHARECIWHLILK